MKNKVYVFSGAPPTFVKGGDVPAAEVLKFMQAQLEILRDITESYVLVPEGTRLREEKTE